MREPVVSLSALTPEQSVRFKQLTTAPALAIPAFVMYCVGMGTFIASDYNAVVGNIPLWVAMVANSIVGYWVFTVGHDAVHRSVSSNTRLNDFIGQTGLMLAAPYVNIKLFRWCHILHHRFANGPKDPDKFFKGPWWSLPFRWMVIDLYYFYYVLKHGDKVSKPYFREALIAGGLSIALLAWLIHAGYGLQVLMLWFIPSRFIFGTVGFSFFWLPHVPHDTTQEENFTRATTIRIGHEWLLAPLLQYQHVHLIHHLYPMTPAYNNGEVWKIIEPELRKKDLAIQHGFAIRPTVHLAPNLAPK